MAPLLYAHRGAAAEAPENTLESFRRACALGADVLEMDLHMTADGHVVVAHDPDGARRAGVPSEIRRSSLDEVKRWDVGAGCRVPTLAEVLAEFPTTPLNVDVKQRHPDMTGAVVELLRRTRAEERVLIASFRTGTLRKIRRLGYRGKTAFGRLETLAFLLLPRALLRRLRLGDALQIPWRAFGVSFARRGLVEKAHALGLRVDYWTVNDPEEARRLLALGCDGIMTDDPARLAPVFGKPVSLAGSRG